MGYRNIEHGNDARIRIDAVGDAVHDHRHRSDAPVDFRAICHVYRGNRIHDHIVACVNAYLLRLNLLRMFHVKLSLAVNVHPSFHRHACYSAFCRKSIGRLSVNVCDNRLHILAETIPFPAKGIADHHRRLRKTHMTCHRAVCFPPVKLFHWHADSLLFHNGRPKRR